MNDFTKTGLDRRTVVKGAAWSVPVLAAAVATPLAAATTVNWNAGIATGCFVGIEGVGGVVPSFRVSETLGHNTTAPQVISETYSQDFEGTAQLSSTLASAQGLVIAGLVATEWALFRVSTVLQGQNSPKITRDPWPVFVDDDFDVDIVQTGSGLGARWTPVVKLRATRGVTVSGLSANESVAWGYAASVLSGLKVTILGLGIEIGDPSQITATITSGTGFVSGDETATLTNLLSC